MSNIRDTDLVLVSRSGTHYKCPASDLSNKLRDGDYLLVSRSGTHYKVSGADVNNIRDTDTLLISRGSTPYKVTGADFKTLLGPTKAEVFGDKHYFGNGSTQTVDTGMFAADRSLVIIRPNTSQYFTFAGFYDSPSGVAYDETFIHSPGHGSDDRVFTDYFVQSWNIGFILTGGPSGFVQEFKKINASGESYKARQFNAAPGFMDWANYTGNGSSQRIYHDLGEVPGAILIFPTSIDWALYTAWHNKSPNHVHVVGPSSDSDKDSSDNTYGAVGSKLYSSLSGAPITSVTSTYIDVNSSKYSNFDNATYSVVFFGGGGSGSNLIKCGQYTGTGSPQTINMDFAPSFFLQWKADSNNNDTNGLAYYGGGRVAAVNGLGNALTGYAFDRVHETNVELTGNLLDAWLSMENNNQNGVIIADDSYYLGWNQNGIKYNYIAV